MPTSRSPASISLFLLLAFLGVTFGARSALAGPPPAGAPDSAVRAERLVYDIRWGPFSAGQAVLEILPDPLAGNEGGYRMELTAETSGLFKRVYPLDVWIRSTLSRNLQRSLAFHKIQNDQDMHILFDWERGTAQYVRDGRELAPIALPPSAVDPLGLIMALRRQDPAVGSRMKTFFTDGKRSVEGTASVLREERIETEAGDFATMVVQPELRGVGGVFARSRNPSMTVWISRDARRLPVRISSKIALGHLVGELVKVESLDPTLVAVGAAPLGKSAR